MTLPSRPARLAMIAAAGAEPGASPAVPRPRPLAVDVPDGIPSRSGRRPDRGAARARGRRGMAMPSGPVPGVPDPAQRSRWQLAQEVWQESGVTWEGIVPELADVEPAVVEPAAASRPAPNPRRPRGGPTSKPPYVEGLPTSSRPTRARRSRSWPGGPQAWRPQSWTPPSGGRAPSPPLPTCGRAARSPATSSGPLPMRRRTGRPPGDTEFGATDPDGFEPVADEEFGDPGGAETWFTGVGPADSRFVDARSARPRPRRCPAGQSNGAGIAGASGTGRVGEGWRAQRPGAGRGMSTRRTVSPGRRGQSAPGGCRWGAPVALDPQAPSGDLTGPFSAAEPDPGAPGWAGRTPLSEPDELFRAWQGSVNRAAAARGPWSCRDGPHRRRAAGARCRRPRSACLWRSSSPSGRAR